jgi:hypothetical protein
MKVEDEWIHIAGRSYAKHDPNGRYTPASIRDALAAVAPLIRRAALEEAPGVVDCGCAHKADVLAVRDENSGDRWRACGSSSCGALEARAIRALDAAPREAKGSE